MKRDTFRCDPHLGGQKETVSPGFIANSLEYGGIKTGIVDLLAHTKEQNCVLFFSHCSISALPPSKCYTISVIEIKSSCQF